MTSSVGDGPPDPVGQLCENKQSATEKPLGNGSLTIWPKAEFLHWAQVLARRLANWHIDDDGPVWAPQGVDFLQEIERPFRYRVMLGEHDSEKTFAPPIRVISTVPNANSDNDLAGYAVSLFPDGYRKDETVWLFRDYYEHLVQLGHSDAEELLRLKIEQLLDSRMYRRARSEVLGDYIAGHPVNHSLLDELVEAAKHCFDNTSPGRKCGNCGKPIRKRDYDRAECNDCRSPVGKLADLDIAIHASGDSPDRILEWPTIRAFLRDAFGLDRTNEKLWELMTDRLRVVGWNDERWLRTKYDEFIELLRAGLMNDRSIIEGIERDTPADDLRQPDPVITAPASIDRRSIEEIERNTPALDVKSIEWIAARKTNQEKLGYPTSTLATYRLESSGGRQLSAYFGIDRDGRRWRRQSDKTEGSTVFYFAADLKKYQTKVSN